MAVRIYVCVNVRNNVFDILWDVNAYIYIGSFSNIEGGIWNFDDLAFSRLRAVSSPLADISFHLPVLF